MKIREEWKRYWMHCLIQLKWAGGSVLLALLFFVVYLPQTVPEKRLALLGGSSVFAACTFGWIYSLYAGAYAWVTWNQIRSGKRTELDWPAHSSIGLGGTAAGILCGGWLRERLWGVPFNPSSFLESMLVGAFISFAFMFFVAYRRTREEALALEASNAQARLHALQNQMKPHFLFNSLNSLSELIELDREQASTMAQKLSDLYRGILENSKCATSPLEGELGIARMYLELERVRYGSRLEFSISAPVETGTVHVPSLVIQALVENAIKHGIARLVTGGRIDVRVAPETGLSGEAGYRLSIENDCDGSAVKAGLKAESSAGSGTGLENTRARLELLYGSAHGFSLERGETRARASFWFSGVKLG